jgi:hypothetical protein
LHSMCLSFLCGSERCQRRVIIKTFVHSIASNEPHLCF